MILQNRIRNAFTRKHIIDESIKNLCDSHKSHGDKIESGIKSGWEKIGANNIGQGIGYLGLGFGIGLIAIGIGLAFRR